MRLRDDLWLEENNVAVSCETTADNFILSSTELEIMKVFYEFSYSSEDKLNNFSEKSGFSLKEMQHRLLLCTFQTYLQALYKIA